MARSLFDPRACATLTQRLARLTPDAPRRWGRMDAHQAVCHLSDAFAWSLGQRSATAEAKPPLPPPLLRWVALRLPLPWPRGGVPTMREADQERDGTRPTEFARDRARLEGLMGAFAALPDVPPVVHPFFGPMSRGDWGRWGWRHCDHHLKQFGV